MGDRITTHVIPRWLRGKVLSPEESPSLGLPLPGVLAEYVLLDEDGAVKTPAYLIEETREWMSGNICRCGAYPGIIAAIGSVAREG